MDFSRDFLPNGYEHRKSCYTGHPCQIGRVFLFLPYIGRDVSRTVVTSYSSSVKEFATERLSEAISTTGN